MDKIKLCDAPESNRAEIGPSELATKYRGKSKKGVSVCPVTLDRVALGIEWYVLSCCVAVSARCSSTCGWLQHGGSSCTCSARRGWLLCITDSTNNVTCNVGHVITVWLLHMRCSSCCNGSTTQIPRSQVQRTSRPLFALQFP